MKKSRFRMLGLLGLLGLLGVPTGNPGFFGFFGAFAFFSLGRIPNDEMLQAYVAKAGRNAFVVSFIGLAVSIAALSVLQTLEAASLLLGAVYVAQLLTFVFSYGMYEKRGDV